MNKGTKRKTLSLIAATSMTIFSLFVVFVGAFAWFSANAHTVTDGNSVNVKVLGKFSKISYHQFSGTPTETNWSFNKTPYASIEYDWDTHKLGKPKDGSGNELSEFKFEMEQYDPMNQNKPVLVLVELRKDFDTSTEGKVLINASTTTDGFMGAKVESEGVKLPKYNLDGTAPNLKLKTEVVEEVSVDYYPLSSVIDFKTKAFSQKEYNTWNSGSTYDLTSGDTAAPHDHNFVSVDNNADISTFEKESCVFDSGVESTVKYIAVVVDYNPAAIEYIYSTYLGDESLEVNYDYILHYLCDWTWEIS